MRFPHRFLGLAAAVAVCAVLVPAQSARAELLGIRGGAYTDLNKPFVGAELIGRFSHDLPLYFNPNVEYVFLENNTYMTLNADFHCDFYTHGPGFVWVGGGLAVIYQNPKGPGAGSTDAAGNLLFGVGLRGDVIPYVQVKLIAKEHTELVIGLGLRF